MNGDPLLRDLGPGLGLYEIGEPPFTSSLPSTAVTYSYFLTVAAPPAGSSPLTLGDTWMGSEWNGWYLFLTEPIVHPTAFAAAGRKQLPQPQDLAPDWRILVWLSSPDPITVLNDLALNPSSATTRSFTGSTNETFAWGDFGILMSGAGATISYNSGAFLFNGVVASAFLQLVYAGTLQLLGYLPYGGSPSTWNLTLAAEGNGTGGFQFNIAIDPGNLTDGLYCGLRYFYPAGNAIADLYYTWSPPVPMTTEPANYLGFMATLNPLITTDPAWSMLALDTSGTNQYQINSHNQTYPYFSTVTGQSIVLTPNAPPSPFPAGYAFCVAPAGGSPDAMTLYLAPAGTFNVQSIGGVSNGQPAQWMCAMSGQEFLDLTPGDLVGLMPGMPAYSGQFTTDASPPQGSPMASPASPGKNMALSRLCTTSWLRYPISAPRRYFGQASSSVYYAQTAVQYSTPVVSLLASLAQPVTMPMVPYSGTYASLGGSPTTPVFNAGVAPLTFSSFEAAAISSDRHAVATEGTSGPKFLGASTLKMRGDVFGSAADAAPAPTALTPQGFVVDLDSSGSWERLLLARDPTVVTPPRYISFDAGSQPTVNRDIANAVMQEQLFLVVSDSTNLGAFENTLTLEGFNFTLDVASGEDVETILIFKFNTNATLRDLAVTPDLWATRDQFVTNVPLTQQRIVEALEVAGVLSPPAESAAEADAFQYFRQIADDPLWTGILALGCAIDGNGMPEDLQMLLGGINGQLRAHHLGIERNRLETPTPGESVLAESSLFGVILYPMPGTPPPSPPPVPPALDYNVEALRVVFFNSGITQFAVEVGLTINNIFGRDTLIAGATSPFSPNENVLLMPGQYQTQGPVGVVLFRVDPTIFDFPVFEGTTRVLESLSITSGSLAPVSSTPISPAGTHLVARFALNGALKFRDSPFPSAPELDIFSFDALPVSGLTVTMEFDLDATGALMPGSKTLTFQPALLKPTNDGAVIRPDSFMYTMPLQITGFLASAGTTPLSTSSLGATVVHSLQLEGHRSDASSPLAPDSGLEQAEAPTDFPYVTATPMFALQFALPLGSLGALSDVVSLTASLLLGWGPSTLVPGADACALLVQMPSLSAGYGSFNLQGILKTTFGDANLLRVELPNSNVYALLFNNIKLSVLGFSFPPGVLIDFLLFAGQPDSQLGDGSSTNTSNIAWYLSAQKG